MPTRTPRAVPIEVDRVAPPQAFTSAVESLDGAALRDDVIVRETPPPMRIAPFAAAVTIDLDDSASGRLVYLHDPAGQQAWSGRDRLVAFARVEVDDAMAADALLADVVWAWLIEAMETHGAGLRVLGGTVTTTSSRRYGNLDHLPPTQEVELRCSWTPLPSPDGSLDLGSHLSGLVDTLAAMSGRPPV
jgi:hypothetical protein